MDKTTKTMAVLFVIIMLVSGCVNNKKTTEYQMSCKATVINVTETGSENGKTTTTTLLLDTQAGRVSFVHTRPNIYLQGDEITLTWTKNVVTDKDGKVIKEYIEKVTLDNRMTFKCTISNTNLLKIKNSSR